MKYSKTYYFIGLFFFLLLIINYNYNIDGLKSNKVKLCSKLNYKDSLNLHPDNFRKINLKLNMVDERKWRRILFESEITARQNSQGAYDNANFYSKSRRADASIEVNIKPGLKCVLLAEIRPHGDLRDHRQGSGLPSLNVKLKDGHLFGIVHFILFRPVSRGYDNEIFATTFLRELNLLAPRSFKSKINYRNLQNNFIFQEKIVKEFLEHSYFRESALFEGDQRFIWIEPTSVNNIFRHRLINKNWARKEKSSLFISETGLSILNEINQYHRGGKIDQVDYFTASKKVGMDKYFDKIPVFDAFVTAINGWHNLSRDDRHFYYDPTIRKFFPIYYDGMSEGIQSILTKDNKVSDYRLARKVVPSAIYGSSEALRRLNTLKIDNLHNELLKNGLNLKKAQVEKMVKLVKNKLTILQNFNSDKIVNVSSDVETKSFMKKNFIENNFVSKRLLYYDKEFRNYLNCNLYGDDCKKVILKPKDKIKALAQELKDENKIHLIFVGKKRKSLTSQGWFNHYAFKESLPENKIQKIKILQSVELLLYGDIDYKLESSSKIIELTRNDSSGKAVFTKGNLDSWKIVFNDNSNDILNSKVDINGYTGCLSFFDIKISKISIESFNAKCEDAINFVRVNGSVQNLIVKNSQFDAIDADFSIIDFDLVNIQNSKNDCMDFSYGNYLIKKAEIKFCGDKAISVGETSKVNVESLLVTNSNIGIAAKDYGFISVNSGEISNTKSCVEVYNKKQEFSGGHIISEKLKCKNSLRDSQVDEMSLLEVNFL